MAAQPKAESTTRLDGLDGLRAISVSLVVASHLLGISSLAPQLEGPLARELFIPAIDEMGALGVNIFFVISGFVICRGMMAAGRPSITGFYVRRFFRIVPPLAIYVAAILALTALFGLKSDLTILRAMTFTCNAGGCGGWFGAHTWSLSVEEQFYLVIPALFLIVRGKVAWAFPVLVISLFAAPYLEPFLPISVGVLCAVHQERLRRWVEASPRWVLPITVLLVAIATRATSTVFHLPAAVALSLLLGAMVMQLAYRPVLDKPLLVSLGRVSYSVYLWQELATARYEGAGPLFYAVAVAAVVAWAYLSFRFIEEPLIAFGRRAGGGKRAKPSCPAVEADRLLAEGGGAAAED